MRKLSRNSCKRESKNHRKFIENRPRRLPGGLQNGSGRPPGDPSARFRYKRAIWWPKRSPRLCRFGDFWLIFGSRPEPQKRSKIDFWPKKGRRGAIFWRFLPRSQLFTIFHQFWVNFRSKIHVFFHRMFAMRRAFLSTWRPSRNTAVAISKHTFSLFDFSRFCGKNDEKSLQNCAPEKAPKNRPPGTRFGAQNRRKSMSEGLEIAQNEEKRKFFEG